MRGWWGHGAIIQWRAYTCKLGRGKARVLLGSSLQCLLLAWPCPRPPASSADNSTLSTQHLGAARDVKAAWLRAHQFWGRRECSSPKPPCASCPGPSHSVLGLAQVSVWRHVCFLGSLRSLEYGHSGKMVCETQRQSSDLKHRSPSGEAPVNCPKSVGFGHPNTPGKLLQHTLTCSYVAVLSCVLIKPNHRISQFPTMVVPSLGLGHAMGAHHPTLSPPPRTPGVQEALESVTQPEDHGQEDALWNSMQLWPLRQGHTPARTFPSQAD